MEYGSDFSIGLGELTYIDDNIFNFLKDFNALYFDSGRSAIRYLLHSIKHKRVALPTYLCESIVDCFSDGEVYYYFVNAHLQIEILEQIPWDSIDVFYLLHYFGTLQPDNVLEYIVEKKREYGFIIIEDTTHSIFTSPITIGDYCICSLRKWFPIPDGGVLYSKRAFDESKHKCLDLKYSERIEGMVLKSLYLKGNVSDKEAYREILINTERQFDKQTDLFRLSTISELILRCQDISEIINKRRKNHAALEDEIGCLFPEIQSRNGNDVPYIYVTRIGNRNALQSYLTKNEIYCPVHWPLPTDWKFETALKFSEELISIPIDQRYGKNEVVNVARKVRGFYNE